MLEPDVTLTDYALAILCGILAWRSMASNTPVRAWLTTFFVVASAASLVGGTVHGFFADGASAMHAALWTATLLLVGMAGLSAWNLAARMIRSTRLVRRVRWISWLSGAGYAGFVVLVLAGEQRFLVAVAYYLPATLFLLGTLISLELADPTRARHVAIAGVVLTLVAAAIQQAGSPVYPPYMGRNSLYHVVQAVA
ncbi:MAG: hypothetical protein WC273_06970, partial [Dehalococcoidia bacterium]